MKEKSDDDEIPNYIKVQNTVIATQGISSNPEVITKIAFTSQSESIIQLENHKIFYSFLSHQLQQFKFSITIYTEVI